MARTTEVDTVRGLALFGICVVNVPFLAMPADAVFARQNGIDGVAQFLIEWLFQGKFFVVFSFLFGWGLALQITSAERASVSPSGRFLRRLVGLAAIGVLHAVFVFFGDILVLYAILGVPLLMLRNASPRSLINIAGAAMVIGFFTLASIVAALPEDPLTAMPSSHRSGYLGGFAESVRQRLSDWPFGFIFILLFNGPIAFAAFCAGLAAAKVDFFATGSAIYGAVLRRLPLLLAAGLLLNLSYAIAAGGHLGTGLAAMLAVALLAIAGPLLGAAYLIIMVECARKGYLGAATIASGRMSLTCYILEGFLAGLIFNGYGLGLFGAVGWTMCFVFAVAIYAATHAFAGLWLKFADQGPLEALLRSWTRLGETRRG